MKSLIYLGFGVGLIALGGCNQAGSYKPTEKPEAKEVALAAGKEQTLWPMKQGNQWTYEATDAISGPTNQETKTDVTLRVVSTTPKDGGVVADIDVIVKDEVRDRTQWQVTNSGIAQVSGNSKQSPYDPPFLLVPFPFKANSTFSYTGRGPAPLYAPGTAKGTAMNQTVTGQVRDFMEVDTLMGRMKALTVEQTNTYTDQGTQFRSTSTSWWVPTIGLVRFVQITTGGGVTFRQTLRLKSNTAPKGS